MRPEYNVYCDESCHLENDNNKVMVLGAIWVPSYKIKEIFQRVREIKEKHNLNKLYEIKWNKVSKGKKEFFKELIDFFFDDDHLHFRALIVPDKNALDHGKYKQTHDDFYYKMYFDMLKVIFEPNSSYNIYLDIKDTKSQEKVLKLAEVLRTSNYDFSKQIIKKIQLVRSHEIELLQLADLFIGAVAYLNNDHKGSSTKLELIERIKHRSRYSLKNTTLMKEDKMNIFRWRHSQNA